MSTYYSNGKLLISAEYLVLDGAVALALPTKYGQSLDVLENDSNEIQWNSYNVLNTCWFHAVFDMHSLEIKNCTDQKIANTLQAILQTAKKLNPAFLSTSAGVHVKTTLTFPNEWGLGTSSTLIHSIATWAAVNPFELLELSFGGSGYDIACAKHHKPITFQRNGSTPIIQELAFAPSFKNHLFFVYLNEKQDSKEGISLYKKLQVNKKDSIQQVNNITSRMIVAKTLSEFELLIEEHENLISSLIGMPTVKKKLFNDYQGCVKSLGAWGGDFVLVTGSLANVKNYFTTKGYTTIVPYDEMIKD